MKLSNVEPSKEAEFLTFFSGFDFGKYANELFKEIRASRSFRDEDLELIEINEEKK